MANAVHVMTGREMRATTHRPMPGGSKAPTPRVVPAFTPESRQPNTVVAKPPKCDPRKEREPRPSMFKLYYKRGDLPLTCRTVGRDVCLTWKTRAGEVDYDRFLPLIFEGLRFKEAPYCLIAEKAAIFLMECNGAKVLPLIPQLAMPIKEAMDTRNKDVIASTLKVIQELIRCHPYSGEALVPYYRQILPMFNLFAGSLFLYQESPGVRGRKTLGNLIDETLRRLEQTGGPDAYINIKYMVPTYQSGLYN